jgi:hypothetical protein
VSGDYSAVLRVRAGDQGWSKDLPLVAETPFSGPELGLPLALDLGQLWTLLEAIERETEVRPATYDLTVLPTIRLKGQVGPYAIEESYSPAFALRLSRSALVPDGNLLREEPAKTITETVTRRNRLSLAGLSVDVAQARLAGLAGLGASLAAAGLLAAVVFLGLGQDEAAQIRARYGSLLISVAQADLKEEGRRVQVATIQDLVRLAQRDGRPIFHQALGPDAHRYFIPDGAVTYEYRVTGRAEAAPPQEA